MKRTTFLLAAAFVLCGISGAMAQEASAVVAGTTTPKFCAGNEMRVTAKLNSIRGALAVYYGDTEGYYPETLKALVPKYLPAIPAISLCDEKNAIVHPGSRRVSDVSAVSPTDAGGWGYVSDRNSTSWGTVFVNCAHNAPSGKPWYQQ